MIKPLIGISLVLLAGALALLVTMRMISPAPVQTVAEIKSPPQRVTNVNGTLYWLEADQAYGKPQRLLKCEPDGRPQALVSKLEIQSYSVAGEDVYYIEKKGSAVKRLSARGSETSTLADHAASPGEVYADSDHVYWTESVDPSLSSVMHVPIAHGLTRIHQVDRKGGQPRIAAVTESTSPTFTGRIISSHGDDLYWVEWNIRGQGRVTSALKKANTKDGRVSLLSQALGKREYMLAGEHLYCIAESEEASPASQFVCIKRIPLKGGAEETLTEWLDSDGTLVPYPSSSTGAPARLFYLFRNRVWELPTSRVAPPTIAMQIDDHDACFALLNGMLFSYTRPIVGVPTMLHRQPLRLRGTIMRAFGMGM